MNILKLVPSLYSGNDGSIHVDIALHIDGVKLENYDTDPFDLFNLLRDPEWITDPLERYVYFWTCSCGEPGCASLAESKILKRDAETVSVGIPQPINYHSFATHRDDPEKYDSGYKRWQVEHKVKLVTFNIADLKAELLRFAQELREMTKNVTLWSYSGGHHKYEEDDDLIDMPTVIEESLQKL